MISAPGKLAGVVALGLVDLKETPAHSRRGRRLNGPTRIPTKPGGEVDVIRRFYGPETPVLKGTHRVPVVSRVGGQGRAAKDWKATAMRES